MADVQSYLEEPSTENQMALEDALHRAEKAYSEFKEYAEENELLRERLKEARAAAKAFLRELGKEE